VGQTLGRYQIIEHLGRGGMAEVYKAYQPSLDRYVAIKVMHSFLASDKGFLERFEREAKAIASLRHPNIVQVYDFDISDGVYYLVMEFIDGVTLKTWMEQLLARKEMLSLKQALRIILAIGEALRYAHEHKDGMVHRDVKPANVMITQEGEAILTDFGIARIMSGSTLTASGTMVGTPSYMSPEQGMGEPGDARSDIYSLGVMLYQLVTGYLPYDADTPVAVVLKHINAPLPLPSRVKPNLPDSVERVIVRAMAKDKHDRYQRVADMLSDLRHAMSLVGGVDHARVFISYKPNAEPDETFAMHLHQALHERGHHPFVDPKGNPIDVEWAREIQQQVENCDYLIALLSAESANSEMVATEIEYAQQHQDTHGRPAILPVRLAYPEKLPYRLTTYLDQLQHVNWRSEEDTEEVVATLLSAIEGTRTLPHDVYNNPTLPGSRLEISNDGRTLNFGQLVETPLPSFDPRAILETPSGTVKLKSQLYIEREGDESLRRQVSGAGTTTTIRGPRQMGKTSLLVRGVHEARRHGQPVVYIDMQRVNQSYLASLDGLLRYFADEIAMRLSVDAAGVDRIWSSSRGAQDKLNTFLEMQVLPTVDTPILLAVDEADRLLDVPFKTDFFGLVRAWDSNRAYDELWENLNIVLVISTHPHLLITDVSQSPFNVGLRIQLNDFDESQVEDLNRRHGLAVSPRDLPRLYDLLGGHPYLTRQAMYTLIDRKMTWAEFADMAPTDDGPFGSHLRSYLWQLSTRPDLVAGMLQVLRQGRCDDEQVLYRLSAAGLVKELGERCIPRCGLYAEYFGAKLR
jgi:serine/threonine protein kinase